MHQTQTHGPAAAAHVGSVMDGTRRVRNYEFRYPGFAFDGQEGARRVHAVALPRPPVHHMMLTPFLTGRLAPLSSSEGATTSSMPRRPAAAAARGGSPHDNDSDNDDGGIPATRLYSWVGRPLGSGPVRHGGGKAAAAPPPLRAPPPRKHGSAPPLSSSSASSSSSSYPRRRGVVATKTRKRTDHPEDRPLIIAFACPARARAEAEAQKRELMTTEAAGIGVPAVVVEGKGGDPEDDPRSRPPHDVEVVGLSVDDARDLGRHMKMPVLVVLASRCGVESREVVHDVALLRRSGDVA